jgi:hypothetical protein
MSQIYEFTELDQAVRRMVVERQWQEDLENYGGSWVSWVCDVQDADDGTGDAILTFPDELVMLKGWKEGTVLNMEIEQRPTGNVLIITEKKDESI